MGLTHIGEIVERLIANGRPPSTPAIAVRWGTRPEQKTVTTTLNELPAAVAAAHLKPPATVIIGGVVSLRDKLNWYEKLPLFGKRVVVTRAREQSGDLAARLRSLGATVAEFPTIAICPADDYSALDAAIARLDQYDWLIFTSVNGVRFFLERLDRSATVDLRRLRARLCAIGPATRQALERLHLNVDLMPADYVAESLVAAFGPHDLSGKRILLPRAAVARDVIPVELSRRGAKVDVVEAYRTEIPEFANEFAREAFAVTPDWVTFTSSSTVRNFVTITGREVLKGVKVASIGPVTTSAARRLGLEVTAEADPFTIDGLIAAILRAP